MLDFRDISVKVKVKVGQDLALLVLFASRIFAGIAELGLSGVRDHHKLETVEAFAISVST